MNTKSDFVSGLWQRLQTGGQPLLLLMRLALGGTLIVSGLAKLTSGTDFVGVVSSYGMLPQALAELYGSVLPWLELLVGVSLVLGLFTRLAAAAAFCLVVSFTVANVHALVGDTYRSGADLCGCIGTAVPLDHKGALAMDAAMLVAAIPMILFKTRLLSLGSRFSFDWPSMSRRGFAHSLPANVTMALVATLMLIPSSLLVGNQTAVDRAPATSVQSIIDAALDDGTPVFLFVYLDTCSYCQKEKPIIDRLESEYGDRVAFVRANGAEEPEIVSTFGFDGYPAMALISGRDKNGDYIYRSFVGFTSEETLRAALEVLISGSYSAVDMAIDNGLAEGKPVFLFIYAEWCTYCKKQKPIIDSLEAEYGDLVIFLRVDAAENPEALKEFDVTGFPAMFLITERGEAGYAYRGFSGFTERETLAGVIDYVLYNGQLPDGDVGYEHHSCSVGTCYENCIADKFEYPSMIDMERFLTDAALDCLGASAGDAFKNAYENAKTGECAYACASADDPREYGDCAQCAIGETIGKIPAAGCVVTLWSALGDVLEPHADCLAECAAPSSTWEKNWGHACRDFQGEQTRCAGPNLMETLGCRDCGWVVTNVLACDDGCEMTAAGAACKGKCKEEWCDDGDECTIDWCLRGECQHERKSGCCPPPGCDDGDPCTTDYCDESGACQHTDNPACRCQNKNCDDGDRCTIDSCDSTTGSCVNARMPGCDTPDDNEDSSSMYYDGSGESDPNAQIAILTNGFSLFLLDKLDGLGYGATIIQTIDEAFAYPVLAIPSGGLSGLDTSDVFKTKLERYVSEGGILISFTQQRGTEFQALPGGQLSGYGWIEDESCHANSVGITEYHPIFSGSGGGVLGINVDGFFTSYPTGAAVLLSRVKNGQPAMVLYDYGDGTVLASTIYSDMAVSLYQTITQESVLLRDMFAWALSQDDVETLSLKEMTLSIPVHNPYTGTVDLPVFQIGDEVAFSIDVTNTGTASANMVKFLVSDPHFNQSWVEVKKTIGAGKTEAVDFAFPTDGSSGEGVWTVLYFLYDGEEFLGADMGGRFTVGYEPADYSSFKAIVTIKDPEGNAILEQSQDIAIAPGETGNIQVSLPNSSAMGIWSARYSVLMSDNTVLLSSLKRFARSVYAESEGGWNYQASKIGFDVVSDHDQVVKGSSETFYIHIYNRGDAEVTLSYQLDWSHWNIGERQTATVPAGSTVTLPHTMVVSDRGRFWVHFYDAAGSVHLGDASKGMAMFLPYIEVDVSTDRPSYSIGESVTATVELTNMGLVAQDVHTVVQIQKFAYGYVTLGEQTIDLNLLPYTAGDTATQIRTLTFPLPAGLTPGSTYTVRVQSSIGTERVGLDAATFRFTAPYVVGLRVDRPDRRYGAGDPIQISADIQNISASPRETDVEIAAPALGSPQTQHVTLGPGATQTISYSTSVPVSMASGVHDITVTLSDGGLTKMSNFVVPAPRLHLDVDAPSHNAGEELHLLIENIGGTYVEWTGTLSADFATGPVAGTGSLMPQLSDNTSMHIAIPIDTVPGLHWVYAKCSAQGNSFYLSTYVDIYGPDISLALPDTTYSAGEEVSITVTNASPTVPSTALCSIDLTDQFRDTVYSENGTVKNVPAGASVPLPFTIPSWAASGSYRLEASCADSATSKVASLISYLSVTGMSASLTSVTDWETYSASDNIDVQTQIINSALPLSGTLHLWMWEAVKSESVLKRVWANHEGGTGTDTPAAITVDSSGNVYVTGARQNGTYTDYWTIKYSPEGVRLWEATYAGESDRDDKSSAIVVDASGNVYVTGTSYEQKPFIITPTPIKTCTTVKYNAAGAQQWVKNYHGAANTLDEGTAIAVYGDSVYVAGHTYGSTTSWDHLTIKYNAGTGVQEWAGIYAGPGSYLDYATGLVVDGVGNVYVTGYACFSDNGTNNVYMTTMKYSSGGTQQWASHSEYPVSMFAYTSAAYIAFWQADVGDPGYVIVAGEAIRGTSSDFGVMKYDTTDGTQEWAQYYDGPVNGADTVVGLAVDSAGNAIVTGSVTVAASGLELFDRDIAVRKYDAAGTLKWAASYGSSAWINDDPAGVAVDADGNVFVAGNSPTWQGWATLKYAGESGDLEWITTYTGLDEGQEVAAAIAVSAAGAIHVTGMSSGDYATVKYVERSTGDAVWETDIPVSLAALETRNISTLVGIPTELAGITGKLYLGAELLSSGNRTIALSQPHAFYITSSSLSLTMERTPYKDFCRPGETIAISGTVRNNGTGSEDCTLTITKDGVVIFTEAFTLGVDGLHPYTTSTSSDSTFLLEATVNSVTVADTVTIKPYNLDVTIITPDVVGLAAFEAGVLLKNSSDMRYTLHVVLSTAVWDNVTLEPGESRLLQTSLSVTQDTVLTATVSGDAPMTIQKSVTMGERAVVEMAPDQTYAAGPIEAAFTVANTGLLDVAFSITFTMETQVVIREVFVPAGASVNETVSLNLADGNHTLSYTSLHGSGSAQIHTAGDPEFVVTETPSNVDLVVGDPTWAFKVKNIGGSEGAAQLTLMVPDFQETQLVWLTPGEEKAVSFTFVIPDDLEGKDYKASYTLNGETTEFVFHLDGPKVTVAASLDKELYQAGETAVLTLKVDNASEFDMDLFARVQLGEHLEIVDFELNGTGASRTLTFNVPVDFDSGKLFYGIYMRSGRALHLNALYVRERQSLVLSMTHQVYDMGEEAIITVEPQGPGTLTLTAPGGYSANSALSGPASFKFTIPALVTGTYYVEYTFVSGTGTVTGKYPFDVRGYSARITRLKVDKNKYAPGDTISITLDAELNLAVDNGTVRYRIYDRKNNLVDDFQVATTMAAGDNHVVTSRTLSADVSGTVLLLATLSGDLPGQAGTMLASAVRYFDGGGTNLAPEPEAGLPYIGTEGAVVLFDAGLSSDPEADPLQYRWDFDNDGTWDTDWSADPTGAWTYGDQWEGKAKVEVKDATGSAVVVTNVVLSNMAPWVDAGPVREVAAGKKLTFYGSFVDPGKLDTHTILWDFGDGSTDSEGLSPTHVYDEPGTYEVTLTVTDDDGGVGTATLSITVGDRSEGGVPFWVWILVGLGGVALVGIVAFLLWRWRSGRRPASTPSPS